MGRPRTFDTEDAAFAILDVFWARGYKATSLADLMQATGLNKSSLYAAFGDKRAMYLKAMALYDAAYVDRAIEALNQKKGKAALKAFLHLPAAAVEQGDTRGCFLCNASSETEALDEEAKHLADTGRAKLQAALRGVLKEMPKAAKGRSGADHIADQLLALYFGLRVLARSGFAPDRLKSAATSFLTTLGTG